MMRGFNLLIFSKLKDIYYKYTMTTDIICSDKTIQINTDLFKKYSNKNDITIDFESKYFEKIKEYCEHHINGEVPRPLQQIDINSTIDNKFIYKWDKEFFLSFDFETLKSIGIIADQLNMTELTKKCAMAIAITLFPKNENDKKKLPAKIAELTGDK